MKKENIEQVGEGQRSSWLGVGVPLIGFLVVVGIAVFLMLGQQGRVKEAEQKLQAQQDQMAEQNIANGLPADYPSDIVPLIENAEIVTAETGDAQSKQGDAMQMWKIIAGIDDDGRRRIFDYYNNLLLGRGFRQTLVTSMPSHDNTGPNFAVEYGSETMSISIVVEKKSTDEVTQIELTVYRVKE